MFTVSTLAKAAGLNVDTVRYYARLGLIRESGRTPGGHRYFDDGALQRVLFIRGAQWFDLRLDEIRELLEVSDNGDGASTLTQALLEQKIAAIDAQRQRLDRIRSVLSRLLDNAGSGFNATAMLVGASNRRREPERAREHLLRGRADAADDHLAQAGVF